MLLPRFTRLACSIGTRRLSSQFQAPVARILSNRWIWGATLGATCLALTSHKIHLDANQAKEAVEDTIVDPSTSIPFPRTIRIPSNPTLPSLTLVGCGVRTVSFLSIKVYSVGFYADLGNPNLRVYKSMSPEEKIKHIVNNTSCVIRIVPTRSTSYTHLRDAFVRALNSRMSLGIKSGELSEEVAQTVASPLRKLKSLFPNSPLAKHTPLDIYLSAPTADRHRALVFRDLGSIENNWIATEFVLHYFEGDGPSPALKKSVLENLTKFQK